MRFVFLALALGCDTAAMSSPGMDADLGSDAGASDAGADTGTDAGPPAFVAVYDVLHARNCIYPCHDRTAYGGMSLSPFDGNPVRHPDDDLELAYDALMAPRATSMFCAGEVRIVPGDPEASLLVRKVATDGPAPCGERMPAGTFPRMPAEDVEVLRAWIAGGAVL
jgi:hypothetical protein